jgi:hypothetical protein
MAGRSTRVRSEAARGRGIAKPSQASAKSCSALHEHSRASRRQGRASPWRRYAQLGDTADRTGGCEAPRVNARA